MSDVANSNEPDESRALSVVSSGIPISDAAGGLDLNSVEQAVKVAKLMSTAGAMIPKFLRGQWGACLGIVLQAREWRMSPYQVARQAYVVENKKTGESTVAYMAQLTNAVIKSRAPITEDGLMVSYEGEGDDLVCTVSAQLRKRDGSPGRIISHRSPTLGERKKALKIKFRASEDGDEAIVRGSPLWVSKPEVQIFYDTSRDLGRIYFPEVLMGIYTKEEMEEHGWEASQTSMSHYQQSESAAVEQGLSERLSAQAISRYGFNVDEALSGLEQASADNQAATSETEKSAAAKVDPKPRSRRAKASGSPPATVEQGPATLPPKTTEARPEPSVAQQTPAAKSDQIEQHASTGGFSQPPRATDDPLEVAYRAGRRAYFNNIARSARAYANMPSFRAEWERGWDEREAEEKGKQT